MLSFLRTSNSPQPVELEEEGPSQDTLHFRQRESTRAV